MSVNSSNITGQQFIRRRLYSRFHATFKSHYLKTDDRTKQEAHKNNKQGVYTREQKRGERSARMSAPISLSRFRNTQTSVRTGPSGEARKSPLQQGNFMPNRGKMKTEIYGQNQDTNCAPVRSGSTAEFFTFPQRASPP